MQGILCLDRTYISSNRGRLLTWLWTVCPSGCVGKSWALLGPVDAWGLGLSSPWPPGPSLAHKGHRREGCAGECRSGAQLASFGQALLAGLVF